MREITPSGRKFLKYGCLTPILVILSLIAFYFFYFFVVSIPFNIHARQQCVNLENGLYVGYNAALRLWKPRFWGPYLFLKHPDGTPLVNQRLKSLYVTPKYVVGETSDVKGEPRYYYYWTPQSGLSLNPKHRDYTFQELIEDLDARPKSDDLIAIPILGYEGHQMTANWRYLTEEKGLPVEKCPTPIFIW